MRIVLAVVMAALVGCGEDGGGGDCAGQDTALECQTCEPGETRCGTRWHGPPEATGWLQTCNEDGRWHGGYTSCEVACDEGDGQAVCIDAS
jgi:hypothetical protein